MKIFLINEGTCTRVKLFGVDAQRLFELNGHQTTERMEDADLVVINTCSFLQSREDFFMQQIEQITRELTHWQKLAVIGCLAPLKKVELLELYPNILLFGRDLSEIKQYFGLSYLPAAQANSVSEKLTLKNTCLYWLNRLILRSPHIDYRLKRDKVCYLQISSGCIGRCTYCSERFITVLRSQPINQILDAISDGIESGYKLFGLSSDDASAYGMDIGASLDELLESIVQIDSSIYFNIPEFNPNGLTERVLECLKDPKFLYITIPVQSGSQRILDQMGRPYDISEVMEKVRRIRAGNQKLMINTHIIVGFPGETEQDFAATENLLASGLFDRVKVFCYSPRPGTEAATFTGQISEEAKQQRKAKLLKIMRQVNFRKFSLVNLILNGEQLK